jgi:hypothetical protein
MYIIFRNGIFDKAVATKEETTEYRIDNGCEIYETQLNPEWHNFQISRKGELIASLNQQGYSAMVDSNIKAAMDSQKDKDIIAFNQMSLWKKWRFFMGNFYNGN